MVNWRAALVCCDIFTFLPWKLEQIIHLLLNWWSGIFPHIFHLFFPRSILFPSKTKDQIKWISPFSFCYLRHVMIYKYLGYFRFNLSKTATLEIPNWFFSWVNACFVAIFCTLIQHTQQIVNSFLGLSIFDWKLTWKIYLINYPEAFESKMKNARQNIDAHIRNHLNCV